MRKKRVLTDYRREYLGLTVSEHRRRLKARCVAYKGGKCVECGFSGCPAAFDFHHPDPKKKDFGIAGKCKSFDRLKPELDKTILLCANCHREVHDKWNEAALKAKREKFEALPKPKTGRRYGPRAVLVQAAAC